MSSVVNYIGQPVSLLTVWIFAGSVYGLLWWWSRPEQPTAPTGLLAWAREPAATGNEPDDSEDEEPAELDEAADDEQADDEPDPADIVPNLVTAPQAMVTARSFRLGDEDVTFNFRASA